MNKKRRLTALGSAVMLFVLASALYTTTSHPVYGLETIPMPPAPTNLQAFGYDDHVGIVLIWNSPSDSGSSQVTGYQIERSADGGSIWTTIVSNTGSTQTAYGENCLAPDTKYTYRVLALSSSGISDPSNTASTITHGTMIPDAPTSPAATFLSSSQIHLSWAAPSCNEGSPITKYNIERSADGGITWSTISSKFNGNSFTDLVHGLGKKIIYKITAINYAGESLPLYLSVKLH